MEVVLLLAAVIGIALIAVPRLQARRRPSKRARANVVRRAAAATPVATSWSPGSPDEDAWDDDLGWEGPDAPDTSWSEAAELPSTARADWLEDDDGLGWEG